MAKITRVAAKEYDSLMKALRRTGVKKSATVARLLLETWAYEDGHINSEWWVREGGCTKGEFTKLRTNLIRDGWINFREDTKKYLVGSRLKTYIDRFEQNRTASIADLNKINLKIDLLEEKKADKKELKEVKDEVQDIKAQMNEIREILAELHRLQAPPPSLEAQQKSAELTIRLSSLLKNSIN